MIKRAFAMTSLMALTILASTSVVRAAIVSVLENHISVTGFRLLNSSSATKPAQIAKI